MKKLDQYQNRKNMSKAVSVGSHSIFDYDILFSSSGLRESNVTLSLGSRTLSLGSLFIFSVSNYLTVFFCKIYNVILNQDTSLPTFYL